MTLQVLADAGEVGLQAVHADVLVVTVTQDVVKVKVQDVGVEAADLQVVLEEGQRSEVRRTNTNRSSASKNVALKCSNKDCFLSFCKL